MANGWGILSWGQGNWNSQGDSAVQLTGQGLTSTLGNISYGWGILSWGQGNWGLQNYLTVSVTGQQLTGTVGKLDAYNLSGWGRLTWGSLTWGQGITDVKFTVTGLLATTALRSVNIGIGPNVRVTGQLLTLTEGSIASVKGNATARVTADTSLRLVTTLNSVSTKISSKVPVTGIQLTLTENSVVTKANGKTSLTGQQLTLTENSVSVKANATARVIGDESLRLVSQLNNVTTKGTATVPLTGTQLTLTENSVVTKANANTSLTGQQLNTFEGSVSIKASASDIYAIGQTLNTTVGELDVGPDASASGIEVPAYVGDVFIKAAANVPVADDLLTLSLDSVSIDLNTPANITGIQLTTTLNSIIARSSVNVPVSDGTLTLHLLPEVNTTLHDSMTTYDTNAYINDLTIYEVIPSSGTAKIGNEYVFYSSKSIYTLDANTFVLEGLTRGINGTTPSDHAKNSSIIIEKSILAYGNANIFASGEQLNLIEGSVDVSPDAEVFGQQLTTVLNSVTASIPETVTITGENLLNLSSFPNIDTTLHDSMTTYDTSAFINDLTVYKQIPDSGVVKLQNEYAFYSSKSIYSFDLNVFILNGLTRGINGTVASTHPSGSVVRLTEVAKATAGANTSVSGRQLTLTEGVVDSSPDAEVFGQQLTGTVGSLNIRLDTNVPVTGRQLTLTEGVADAGPDANLTGLQLTSVIGNATVKIDVNVPVQQDPPVYVSRIGNVTVELNTPVDITGELLTLSLNDVITRQSANAYVTGINLTTTTGQLYVTAWETINTGQTVNWTPVDTAA